MSQRPGTPGEQAGELKFGQVGIANLRILVADPVRLEAEMRDRVERAPRLFERAAVVVDFGSLTELPSPAAAREMLDGLRAAGTLPVGIAFGSPQSEALARTLGLPVLAKFRAQYERPAGSDSGIIDTPRRPQDSQAAVPAPEAEPPAAVDADLAIEVEAFRSHIETEPVRSGRQLYAADSDLTLMAPVGAGAEVIADGSIHVYGALRGRALAGARGDTKARIFCREFHAELVSIAGHYRVLEEVSADLRGQAVQVSLDGDRIVITAL